MNILYLVFGNNIEHYQQIYFSIYTALKNKSPEDKIIVVAENSQYFNALKDKIEVIDINKQIVQEWEGKYRFFWRVKVKALELVATKYPEKHIMYLDGDTFIFKDLAPLKDALNKGQNFMHLNEGNLCQLKTKTERTMWQQMKNKTFAGITINENTCMWNAGLIAISKDHLKSIDLALELTDEMCAAGVTRRLIEQFSFGVATNHYSPLQPADSWVGHYWGNKPQWNEIITTFIKKCYMENLTLEESLQAIDQLPLHEYPIAVRNSSTQRKLKKLIDSFYKDKKAIFSKM